VDEKPHRRDAEDDEGAQRRALKNDSAPSRCPLRLCGALGLIFPYTLNAHDAFIRIATDPTWNYYTFIYGDE